MLMRSCSLCVLTLLLCARLLVGATLPAPVPIDPEAHEKEALEGIKRIGRMRRRDGRRCSDPERALTVAPLERRRRGVAIDGLENLAWLSEREWVFYTSVSVHAPGNFVLAVDRDGNIHTTDAHVCTILFVTPPEGKEIASVRDFFAGTLPGWGRKRLRWTAHAQPSRALREAVRSVLPEALKNVPKTRTEHCRQIATDSEASVSSRRWALRTLAEEASDRSWQTVASVLCAGANWEARAYALVLLREHRPERADALRPRLVAGLGQGPAARAKALAEAICAVDDRESLAALLWLAVAEDAPHLCTIFEGIAKSQRGKLSWYGGERHRIRNSVNAYGQMDTERAARFYRSLLRSDDGATRQFGIYAIGELRITDAIPELCAACVPEEESCYVASSVSVALGKMGVPAAHDALIGMLAKDPIVRAQAQAALCVMSVVCGFLGGGRRGSWRMGNWATVSKDRRATATRFAQAARKLAERTTDKKLAKEARTTADSLLSQTRSLRRRH